MKTTKQRVCGGYLNISWKEDGGDTHDKDAFIFSIDNKLKFTPQNGQQAVHFDIKGGLGPWFSRSLGVHRNEMMNAADNCYCNTNGKNSNYYNVTTDAEGNSILTGDGAGKNDKGFIPTAIETW